MSDDSPQLNQTDSSEPARLGARLDELVAAPSADTELRDHLAGVLRRELPGVTFSDALAAVIVKELGLLREESSSTWNPADRDVYRYYTPWRKK